MTYGNGLVFYQRKIQNNYNYINIRSVELHLIFLYRVFHEDEGNQTAIGVTNTGYLPDGWHFRFNTDSTAVTAKKVNIGVDGGPPIELSTALTEDLIGSGSKSTIPPRISLSMTEISVIVGVAGMVVILVGIGIFVIFARKPTGHDFTVYPTG